MPTEPTQFTEAEVVETMPTQKILSVEETVKMLVEQAKLSVNQVMIDNGGAKKLKDYHNQLKKLEITSVDDKETYLKVKEINRAVAKYRIAIDKERKAKKELPIKVGKGIEEVIAEYQAYVTPVEALSDEKIDLYERLVKEKEEKEANEKELRTQIRKAELEKNGLTFNGTWWVINEITVGIQMITDMTQDEYEKLLASVKKQNEFNIEAKRIKDEEEAKAKKDAEELAEKNRIESERVANEALALKNEKIEMRKTQLEMLGITDFKLHQLNIEMLSNDEWKANLEEVKNNIAEAKRDADYLVEKNRIEAEIVAERIKIESENKRIKDEADKKEQDRINALILARQTELLEIGLRYSHASESYKVSFIINEMNEYVEIEKALVVSLSDNDFNAKVAEMKTDIEALEVKWEQQQKAREEELEKARQSSLDDKEKINEFITHVQSRKVTLANQDKQLVVDGFIKAFINQLNSL